MWSGADFVGSASRGDASLALNMTAR